jgi:hypothetical protein
MKTINRGHLERDLLSASDRRCRIKRSVILKIIEDAGGLLSLLLRIFVHIFVNFIIFCIKFVNIFNINAMHRNV